MLALVLGATCVTGVILWSLLVRAFIQDESLVYKMLMTGVVVAQTVKGYILWELLEE